MNGEKGQALPLAILALAIGMLLIVPFLGHASASIIGSGIYAKAIDNRNACDAGVEHAIWRLVYDNLGVSIPNVGDHITYQLSETINGVIPTVTVTTNTTGGSGGATGNITGTEDSFTLDDTRCYEPDIVQVSDNIYAIAYRGESNIGCLKTITIGADGSISPPVIDTLIFENNDGYTPDIIHTTGTTYAIAYRALSNDGILKTVSITAEGDISPDVIDTITFDSGEAFTPVVFPVSSNAYAIAYRNGSNDGTLKTVTITADGDISPSVIDTITFDNDIAYEPDMIHVSGDVYAIAYRGKGTRGMLETIAITSDGDISSIISSLTFDEYNGATPDIIHISGNVYAIIYVGRYNYGWLKTITIMPDGTISQDIIASLNYNIAFYTPHILPVTDDIYITIGRTISNNGFLRTVEIATDGSIVNGDVSNYTFDTGSSFEPEIIQVSPGIFTIVYRGAGSVGYLATIGVDAGIGINSYDIIANAGDTSIMAHVSISESTASITSWQIQ